MTEKKLYSPPQLFRVELNQEQAILTTCSTTTTSVNQGGNGGCRPAVAGGCKRRRNFMNADNGARPS